MNDRTALAIFTTRNGQKEVMGSNRFVSVVTYDSSLSGYKRR